MLFHVFKALISGGVIVAITEIAKRNNTAASIVHSLPLVSLFALIWLYGETRDTDLIARHATGTFCFVLPTLPFFLLLPWLLRRGVGFALSLVIGAAVTTALYFLTLRLLKTAGINL